MLYILISTIYYDNKNCIIDINSFITVKLLLFIY